MRFTDKNVCSKYSQHAQNILRGLTFDHFGTSKMLQSMGTLVQVECQQKCLVYKCYTWAPRFYPFRNAQKGYGGVRPVWKTASGDYYFRGWTPLGATKGYPKGPQQGAGSPKKIVNHNSYLFRTVIYFSHPEYFYSYAILKMAICGSHVRFQRCRIYECFNI